MASRDLQIVRTRPVNVRDQGVVGGAMDSPSKGPLEILLPALRRHWIVIVLATVIAGGSAYWLSDRFHQAVYPARTTLAMQQIPLAKNVYSPPLPTRASFLLRSQTFLSDVVTANPGLGFDAEMIFNSMKVTPTDSTQSLVIEVVTADQKTSMDLLQAISDQFKQAVRLERASVMERNILQIEEVMKGVKAAVESSNKNLDNLEKQMLASAGPDELTRRAELDQLYGSKSDLVEELQLLQRKLTRNDRDRQRLISSLYKLEVDVRERILKSRRQQLEAFGTEMTATKKLSAEKEALLSEIAALEARHAEFASSVNRGVQVEGSDSGSSSLDQRDAGEDQAAERVDSSVPSSVDVSDSNESVEGMDQKYEESVTEIATRLSQWIAEVAKVGKAKVGEFDSLTLIYIEGLEGKVNDMVERLTTLQLERSDIEQELTFFTSKQQEVDSKLRSVAKSSDNQYVDQVERAMEELASEESRLEELKSEIDRMQTVADVTLDDYVEVTPVALVPMEFKSDRKKLFAMVFAGVGMLLISPSVVIELLRLRPSPVSTLGKKWNLPVLNVDLSGKVASSDRKERAAIQQHETRLMALRIQQSMFTQTGRVVLFCGLDHEESPMQLIRSLARCFSQREETVLIVQTVPCQLEIAKRQTAEKSGQKAGRLGVAEYLAGEAQEISSLILPTGVSGVDYLPGGCTHSASEAMASSRFTALVEQLKGKYSMILLCGPSTLHPADLQMLAARSDGIVFTVNKKSLSVVFGDEVIRDLIDLGAPILGFAEQPAVTRKPQSMEKTDKEASQKITVS